jgi:RNA polymerase sigma factor (sigma-70 family)
MGFICATSGIPTAGMATFLKAVRSKTYPILDRVTELELIKAAQQGDRVAKDRLVLSNTRLVAAVAARFVGSTHNEANYQDLCTHGVFGLVEAIDRFNTTLGFSFIAYAKYWVYQKISLAWMDRTVRVPVNRQRLQRQISKLSSRGLTVAEIATELNISPVRVKSNRNAINIVSLDAPVAEDSHSLDMTGIISFERASETPTPFDTLVKQEQINGLNDMLNKLNSVERFVICSFFGYRTEKLTLNQIGAALNLSRGRTQSLKNKTLVKMQSLVGSVALLA